MQMQPVNSSAIAAVGHEGTTLRVQFTSGDTYEYQDVDADRFNALITAESPGRHFRTMQLEKGRKIDREEAI